ncbi:hypothetical protein ACEPAG_3411 [Sanghuangporus baumii]
MTDRGGGTHHHGHHRQPERPRSAAPQTGKQEGSTDKDKKPELVKAKDARTHVNRRTTSLWNNRIAPLYAKTVIYQNAAKERVQQAQQAREDHRKKTTERKGEDRKETEQNSDPVLDDLNEKVLSELTESRECEEGVRIQSMTFNRKYQKANKHFLNEFKSITSVTSKQDEEKKNQFLEFCENVGKYAIEKEGKKLQDIQATLDIVNKARAALQELYVMCDAQAVQAVKKDMEEHRPIQSCHSADEAGYIEKSVYEEAEKKLGDLNNRAKEIEKKKKQKKSNAKTNLETAMADMQKLRYPSQKKSTRRW